MSPETGHSRRLWKVAERGCLPGVSPKLPHAALYGPALLPDGSSLSPSPNPLTGRRGPLRSLSQPGSGGLGHAGWAQWAVSLWTAEATQAQPGWGTSPGNSHLCSEKLHGWLLAEGWGTTLG